MLILDTKSLVNTLDNINTKLLIGEDIALENGIEVARWISTRQGERGSYRGSYAPTSFDFEQGIHTFTGERLTAASARHIIGEEAARAVWLLGQQDAAIMAAYDRAIAWMHMAAKSYQNGIYCCGRCALGLWRHYWVAGFKDKSDIIVRGLGVLKELRLGDGRWRRFPFYYTIYTLLDIDLQPALDELKYAQKVMERVQKSSRLDVFTPRRKMILEKALSKL